MSAGVLLCDTLEKPHGLFNSWVKRYYVLTEDCLHRFRRANGDMFFGKEIAHYSLRQIQQLKVDGRCFTFDFRLKSGKNLRRKIRTASQSAAEKWVELIQKAKDKAKGRSGNAAAGTGYRRKVSTLTSKDDDLSGDYTGLLSPVQFGRTDVLLPSPFTLTIQHSDGSVASKGNSLVPDEELCVGAVLRSSVLVVTDEIGRSARLPLQPVFKKRRNKSEHTLKMEEDEEDEEDGSDGAAGGPANHSPEDGIETCKLQLRFDGDRRVSKYKDDTPAGGLTLSALAVSAVAVVACCIMLATSRQDLTGTSGVVATCMVVGTALLGGLVFLDGLRSRSAEGPADEWRILYVALLDDSGKLLERNRRNQNGDASGPPQGDWNFEDMMDTLYTKRPYEIEDNLADVPSQVATPQRWLNAEPKDARLARLRWRYTTEFRRRFGLNVILDTPHRNFDVIKALWPNYYYGISKDGQHPVFYDTPAGIKLKEIRNLGLTDEDLIFHYLWITEFLWQKVMKGDDMSSCVTIYNLKGLDSSVIMGDKKKLIQKCMKLFEQHYPEKTFKVYILNGPWWFNRIAWPIVTSIANKQTLEKIKSMPSANEKFQQSVREIVAEDNIPPSFGGSNPAPLSESAVSYVQHPAHHRFGRSVSARNAS